MIFFSKISSWKGVWKSTHPRYTSIEKSPGTHRVIMLPFCLIKLEISDFGWNSLYVIKYAILSSWLYVVEMKRHTRCMLFMAITFKVSFDEHCSFLCIIKQLDMRFGKSSLLSSDFSYVTNALILACYGYTPWKSVECFSWSILKNNLRLKVISYIY